MIDLYTAPTSNGLRASVILEECGVPYTAHKLDVMKGEGRKPDYLKINPLGSIPAIVDSEGPGGRPFTLTQSWAIVLYVAEKAGKYIPRDPHERALAYQWLMHSAADISGTSTALFQVSVRAPERNAKIEAHIEGLLVDLFRNADRRLADSAFIAGREVTIADFGLYPAFNARRAIADKAGDLKNLKRWGETMAARPGVQRGMTVGT